MKLWSINAASEETGRDKRFLAKILAAVPSDGHLGRFPGWRLKTILDAVHRHECGGKGPGTGLLDEAEAAARELADFTARLEAELDLGTRRAMIEREGSTFGALEKALERCQASLLPDEACLFEPFLDQVLNRWLKKLVDLGGLRVA